MNLDAVHEIPSFGDQTMIPVHNNNIMDETGNEIIYEAAYSYDELFPSLPDNEVKPEVPVVDMGQWTQKMKVKSSVITQAKLITIGFEDPMDLLYTEKAVEVAKAVFDSFGAI